LHKIPFSIEDKQTIKVLRQQKLYGVTKILRMFPFKNWTLSEVKTVLSKIDATSSVEHCSGSGQPRMPQSPDTISHMVAEQSNLNPIDCAVWGILQECVQPPPDHGRGRAAPSCRGGIGPSGPGRIDNAISE